jgi:hypothetical protein
MLSVANINLYDCPGAAGVEGGKMNSVMREIA